MSQKMRFAIAVGILGALSAVGCAAEMTVRVAPPPERTEVVNVAPSAEHFWVRGHWRRQGAGWTWSNGHWEVRRTHEVWVPGHWRPSGREWVWVEGRWIRR